MTKEENKNKYLSTFTGRSYNLDFSRFILAILVILSHSFPLSTGNTADEGLFILSRGQLTFGMVAVSGFFLCGGYYAARTIAEKKSNAYPVKRLRRLLPELIFVVLACEIAGSSISTLSTFDYFFNMDTWKYLLNGLMILKHELPGVFENNIYGATVNGALWTLPVEYLCNVGLFVLWKIGFLDRKRFVFTFPLVIIVSIAGWKMGTVYAELQSAIIAGIFFYFGVVFYMYRDYVCLTYKIFLIMSILAIVFVVIGYSKFALYISFPYMCFYIWMNDRRVPTFLADIGKYSYSLYLWGFPVQQTVVCLNGGSMMPLTCFAISAPIAILLAVVTYNVIEAAGRLSLQKNCHFSASSDDSPKLIR